MKVDRNSMLYWYPKIKDLRIPQPKTVFVEVEPKLAWSIIDGKESYDFIELKMEARKIGYPLFLRTDQLSGKHSWNRTCFVKSEHDLENHIFGVVESALTCDIKGKSTRAFFFREYIPMDSGYTAFWGEMPVNPERRYFIEGGKVLCHHPYWIEEAIRRPSIENWKAVSKKLNTETAKEFELLTGYSLLVAKQFKGFWSVDFCKAKDGRWILIDMALGEESWHPKDCPNNRTKEVSL